MKLWGFKVGTAKLQECRILEIKTKEIVYKCLFRPIEILRLLYEQINLKNDIGSFCRASSVESG